MPNDPQAELQLSEKLAPEVGGAFVMGFAGSCLWNLGWALTAMPGPHRLQQAFRFATRRGLAAGGNFATWAVTFGIFDHFLSKCFGPDNRFSQYVASCTASGLYGLRAGPARFLQHALVGGSVVSATESLVTLLARRRVPTPRQLFYDLEFEKNSPAKEV
eukprot:Gregarina_sp_Poly_1__8052@NODE_462_length_8193_cov_107_458651_g376_i0_p5_GENE_NODE_462_length_8193_cov_107_458651_g376_i0NODE_462_length_8193_cov_107_458651_g376_i0_p5_ORF_typecomplete_len160_score17_24Tim17/PF02466_19/9_8e11_NODE_462_length_8193_cov_107_458651_g376_i038654344